jgi:single-strand DNA-binding protein
MLIGNLTRDPELRYTPNGTAVVTFGLATNRSWMPEGASERREETEFHRIVAWSKLADLCAQLLYKGVKVYVEGRLQTRTWNAQDGTQKTTTEVVIDDMIVLDKKGDRALHQAASDAAGATYQSQAPAAVKPTATAVTNDEVKSEVEEKPEKIEKIEADSAKSSVEPKEDLTPEDIPF